MARFNWSDPVQRDRARVYRNAEVPFVINGVPEVDAVVGKWTDEYLSRQVRARDRRPRVQHWLRMSGCLACACGRGDAAAGLLLGGIVCEVRSPLGYLSLATCCLTCPSPTTTISSITPEKWWVPRASRACSGDLFARGFGCSLLLLPRWVLVLSMCVSKGVHY